MLSCDFRRLLAVALLLTTTLVTMPVSAADFSSAKPVIGSVSAVGSVDLRGVGMSQEGTLFAGDSIRSHEKGYVKVLLGTGTKIELHEKTDVTMNRDAQGVKIAMTTGTMGFTAKSPLRVDVAPFEVIANDGSAGNVAITSTGTAGVKAINGKVTVRNVKTSESFVLTEGQQQLLLLQNGKHLAPIAEVASNNMPPLPSGKPQTPAGKTGGGLAMDTGAWLAVIGGAAIAGVSIAALVIANNNNNDINNLNSTIKNLNSTIAANQAATAAQLHTLQAAITLQANLAQQQTALNQVLANQNAALAALQASGQGNSPQANALKTSIAATQAALSAVGNAQGSAAACASNPASCSTSSLQSTNQSTQNQTNSAITGGNTAVNNSGTGQSSNVGTVNGQGISASIPL